MTPKTYHATSLGLTESLFSHKTNRKRQKLQRKENEKCVISASLGVSFFKVSKCEQIFYLLMAVKSLQI